MLGAYGGSEEFLRKTSALCDEGEGVDVGGEWGDEW